MINRSKIVKQNINEISLFNPTFVDEGIYNFDYGYVQALGHQIITLLENNNILTIFSEKLDNIAKYYVIQFDKDKNKSDRYSDQYNYKMYPCWLTDKEMKLIEDFRENNKVENNKKAGD